MKYTILLITMMWCFSYFDFVLEILIVKKPKKTPQLLTGTILHIKFNNRQKKLDFRGFLACLRGQPDCFIYI